MKNLFYALMLGSLVTINAQCSEAPLELAPQPKTKSSVASFVRDRLSGLCYATSVTGYDSDILPMSDHLRKVSGNEWEQGMLNCNLDHLTMRDFIKSPLIDYEAFEDVFVFKNEKHNYLHSTDNGITKIIILETLCQAGLDGGPASYITFRTPLDCSESGIPESTTLLLKHFMECFPDDELEISGYLYSQDHGDSLAMRLVSRMQGGEPITHICFTSVCLSPKTGSLNVKVIDPTFDPETKIINWVTGSSHPLPAVSQAYFSDLARSLNLELTHDYHFKSDQWINFHDCGRFSTVYLQAHMNGIDPLTLSNSDVYEGLKSLEANEYETFHQTKTDMNPYPRKRSYFSGLTRMFIRTPCEFIMNTFFPKP
jgi:hypothetical protein